MCQGCAAVVMESGVDIYKALRACRRPCIFSDIKSSFVFLLGIATFQKVDVNLFDFLIAISTVSGSGTQLDRRGRSNSIIYLEISFWEARRVDFEDMYHFIMIFLLFGLLEVVFKLRDLSRSIQLLKLYNIARNQLLGHFIRRF